MPVTFAQKITATLLSLLLVVTFLPVPVGGFALADEGEDTTPAAAEEHATDDGLPQSNIRTITWVTGSMNTVISADGKALDITPRSNGVNSPSDVNSSKAASVTAQIDFSNSATAGYAVGDVEIRLSLHIFYDRNGNPADKFTAGIPLAPAVPEDRSFNYYLEDADGDGTNDTVVMTNCKPITGEIKFQTTFSWNYTPSTVADGYTTEVTADFRVKEADGSVTESQAAIVVTNHTSSKLSSASKTFYAKYDSWQDSWGEKPADAEDYFYVLWQGFERVSTSSTQPYIIALVEEEGADLVRGVGASARYFSSSYDPTSYNPNYSRTVYYDAEGNPLTSGSATNFNTPTTNANYYSHSGFVLVRYKKADYNPGDTITNTLTVRLAGQDGCVDERVVSDSFVYYPEGQEPYEGDVYSGFKSWQYGNYANSLQKLIDGESVRFRVMCFNRINAQPYSHTAVDGVYAEQDYTLELIDEQVYFAEDALRLTKDDYHFTDIAVEGYYYETNPDYAGAKKITFTPDIYVKTRANDAWHLYDASVDVDAGVYAAKASYTGRAYSVTLDLDVRLVVDSSEATRAQAQKALDAGKSELRFVNVNTISVQDADGTYESFAKQSSLYSSAIAKAVYEDDAAQYDDTPQLHYFASRIIEDYPFEQTVKKTNITSLTTWDAVNQTQEIGYTLSAENTYGFDREKPGDEELAYEAAHSGYFNIYDNVAFYDLLPLGTSLKEGTLVVEATERVLDASEYTVQAEENWNDTGRTMLTIEVHMDPSQGENWIIKSKVNVYSLLKVTFVLLYPLDSLLDYGTTVVNDYALESLSGAFAGGTDDRGMNGDYRDLDGSGQIRDTDNVYLYSYYCTNTFPLRASVETGYTKAVRSLETAEQIYTSETAVPGGGRYEYRLRYATEQKQGPSSNIVMYDILEEDYGENTYWKGTFEGVDLTQAKSKGIAPVVYYSTLALSSQDEDKTTWQNLADTSVWSTEAPEDLSQVTAVAIDFSKKTDGSAFILPAGSSLIAKIIMRAPIDVADLVDPTVYAYNMPWISRTTTGVDGDGVIETTNIDKGNLTKVSVWHPVEIHKSSEVASGTEENPAKVKLGEELVYTIDVVNTSAANDLVDVVVVDPVPEGLVVDEAAIAVQVGDGEAVLASEDENVACVVDGQTVTFTIAELAAGVTLHFLVPVTVEAQATYENTAEITSIEGVRVSYPSETTYHEPETTAIEITKVWAGESDLADIRPSAEDFAEALTLYNGEEVATRADGSIYEPTVRDNGDNTYTVIYENLPVYTDELTPDWRIEETAVPGYAQDEASREGVRPDGTITNTYSPTPAETEASVIKVLKGREWQTSDTFTFQLTAVTDGAPLPEETEVAAVLDEGSTSIGTATFGTFTFEMPGTYTYEVRELPSGIKNMKDSDNVATITITVTDDDEGNLEAAVTVDSATFENMYEPPTVPKTADPAGDRA